MTLNKSLKKAFDLHVWNIDGTFYIHFLSYITWKSCLRLSGLSPIPMDLAMILMIFRLTKISLALVKNEETEDH